MSDLVNRLRLNNADDIAVLLEEHLRIENGHIEGKSYVAVKIAEEYEAEIRRINAVGQLARQLAEQAHQDYQNMMRDRDGLRDEARELKAENERLGFDFKAKCHEIEIANGEIERLNAKANTWITIAGRQAAALERCRMLFSRGIDPRLDAALDDMDTALHQPNKEER